MYKVLLLLVVLCLVGASYSYQRGPAVSQETWGEWIDQHHESCKQCKDHTAGKPNTDRCEEFVARFRLMAVSQLLDKPENTLSKVDKQIKEYDVEESTEEHKNIIITFDDDSPPKITAGDCKFYLVLRKGSSFGTKLINFEEAGKRLADYATKEWLDCVELYVSKEKVEQVVLVFIEVSDPQE